MFHRNSGAPPETLPNVKYDAPREVCGDRNDFIVLLRNEARNKFLMSIVAGP